MASRYERKDQPKTPKSPGPDRRAPKMGGSFQTPPNSSSRGKGQR